MINIHTIEFVKSAASSDGLVRDLLPQVAFAGRSNFGKSSMLNRLCNRRALARTSGTPGKTAHVNYFSLGEGGYFVDLPGYGFARVSDAEKRRWGQLMDAYFHRNHALKLLILVVDIRHTPTGDDCTMMALCRSHGIPVKVVANKQDKLKKSQIDPAVKVICDTLGVSQDDVLLFSAQTGFGREDLLAYISKSILL